MRLKKVLYVHHSGLLGGAPKSLTYLLNGMNKSEYEAQVLTIRKGPAVNLLKTSGIPVKVAKFMFPFHGSTVSGMSVKLFLRNLIGAYPTYIMAKKYIKQIKPDIIHLNSTCLFLVAKAAKKVSSEIKVICHVREPLLNSLPGKILKIMNHRYVDGFVAIDKFDSDSINSEGKELDIIYNFVDFNKYNASVNGESVRKELNITKEKVVFLFLGRIVPGNGVLELLRAFHKVSQLNTNMHLIVAGFTFKSKNHYEDKVIEESKKVANINILGFTENVPELIAASDIMMCPFTKPHFSRSIIEAAAMGKPAIASNIGGPNELVIDGETGFLYDFTNENALIEKMIILGYNKVIRDEMAKNAIGFARKNFDSGQNTKRTYEFYKRFC